MALKKSEKRLLGLLGVVAVVFLVDRFVLHAKGEAVAESENSLIVNAAARIFSESKPQIHQRSYQNWGRDPFSTAASGDGASGSYASSKPVLKGILWNQGKAYVMINGFVLGEGEEYKGLRVDKINGSEVLCSRGNRSYTLHWRESP